MLLAANILGIARVNKGFEGGIRHYSIRFYNGV